MSSRKPADGRDVPDAPLVGVTPEIHDDELTESGKAELLQRLEEHRKHPEDSVPWEEARSRLTAWMRRGD